MKPRVSTKVVLVNKGVFIKLQLIVGVAGAHVLACEGVLQGGGAVQLQGGQGGQGVRQSEGGQAEGAEADPSRLLQTSHQRTATEHQTGS